MDLVLSAQNLEKSFSAEPLFKELSMGLFTGDRVGLIGRNGAGKSTLLKILADLESPDSGTISKRQGTKVGYVAQSETYPTHLTVGELLSHSLAPLNLDQFEIQKRIAKITEGMFDLDTSIKNLSGGQKKRLAIMATMITEPDIVFFDEPTNHLDLNGILWLENLLLKASFPWVVISHDRYFLERTVRRVGEVDRIYPKGICLLTGGYSDFLEQKKTYKEGLIAHAEALDNKLRRETAWLRRQPKARTTKSKSRIEGAYELGDELSAVKSRLKESTTSQLEFTSSQRKTKKLIEAKNLSISVPNKTLIKDASFTIGPGEVMGIVGPNGCGKSTLLKAIMDSSKLDSGTIKFANDLKIVYFDQHRESLNHTWTLKRALTEHGDNVIFRGRSIHVVSWAKKFGFDYMDLDKSVGSLSGGEQARVVIARLMLEQADILLLDEPTNDLDIPTIEAFEESMETFPGAIIIISHDRYLVSKLATSIFGFNTDGNTKIYADYDQWESEYSKSRSTKATGSSTSSKPKKRTSTTQKRLSYMEQREFDNMETIILEAEEAYEALQEEMALEAVLSDPTLLQQKSQALGEAEKKVQNLYKRWAELEEKQK